MSDHLFAVAEGLGGVFSWQDAASAGLRSRDLRALIRSGAVVDAGPRAYIVATALDRATTPERAHRLMTLATLRAFDGRLAASHHSAAALHDLPFWSVDASRVHAVRQLGASSKRRAGLVVHDAYPPGAVTTSAATGLKSVHPALAVIGTAMLHGDDAGVVAADSALHRRLVTSEELHAWLRRLGGHPRITRARRAVESAEAATESVGETRTRLILKTMPERPEVRCQVPLVDEDGHEWARVDFLVAGRVVVEFDGRVKYRADQAMNPADVADIVWREKRREDRIRAQGKPVVRVVWADLDRPRQVHAMVRYALTTVR